MNGMPVENLDFAWDRPETEATLRAKLAGTSGPERLQLCAWLMREARVEEVWKFLSLQEVAALLPEVAPMLGRRRSVWEHLLRAAHELGRL